MILCSVEFSLLGFKLHDLFFLKEIFVSVSDCGLCKCSHLSKLIFSLMFIVSANGAITEDCDKSIVPSKGELQLYAVSYV